MPKLRKIVCFLMIPVILIVFLESWQFYADQGLRSAQLLLCTLENTILVFFARPTISAFRAFTAADSNDTGLQQMITLLYGAGVILAPILTTTAVVAGFQAYILDFLESLKISFKERLYIIGDGSLVKDAAFKYAEQYRVCCLMPADTDNQERLPYLKRKIVAIPSDYRNLTPFLGDEKIEKAVCVILNFDHWFENYKAVSDTLKYLVAHSEKEPLSVCMVDAPEVYRDVFDSLYAGLCKRLDKPVTALNVRFVDVYQKNAEKFFRDPQLITTPDGKHHILFVGLGGYGRPMLKELLAYMKRNGLWGTIEVFDRQVDRGLAAMAFAEDVVEAENQITQVKAAEDAVWSSELATGKGPIRINYYRAAVGEMNFGLYLDKLMKKENMTEAFFCIDDLTANLECYRMLSYYAKQSEALKLFFRAGADYSESFKAIELQTDRFRRLPDELADVDLVDLEEES